MENIVNKIDIKRVSIIVIALLLAVFAFVTSWVSIGSGLLVVSVVVACMGLKKEVYTPTGSQVKRHTFYFEGESRGVIGDAVKNNFAEGSATVKFLSTGSGRLDISITKDRKFAVLAVSHFIPHRYEPVGEPVVLENEKVSSLCSYLEKCSGKKLF